MCRRMLILLLVCLSANAMADWVYVSSGQNINVYSDPTTIQSESGLFKMRTKWVFSEPEKFNGQPFKLIVREDQFDCAQKKLRNLSSSGYSGSEGVGDVLWHTDKPTEWVEPTVEGNYIHMWNFVCIKQ